MFYPPGYCSSRKVSAWTPPCIAITTRDPRLVFPGDFRSARYIQIVIPLVDRGNSGRCWSVIHTTAVIFLLYKRDPTAELHAVLSLSVISTVFAAMPCHSWRRFRNGARPFGFRATGDHADRRSARRSGTACRSASGLPPVRGAAGCPGRRSRRCRGPAPSGRGCISAAPTCRSLTADHHHGSARRDVEVDAIEHDLVAEALAQVAEADFLGHRSSVIGHRPSAIGHRSSVIGGVVPPGRGGANLRLRARCCRPGQGRGVGRLPVQASITRR